ncbi:electron transfer flavoprotein subunit alpha [Vibrio porteresiae]|uniref:Electron transfer flavoprotein subunit alpha/FixB family protein n=1 Tax=Vibrio porteresiae DSM 19223 TaxID=1123496 RepID=A0ABZ0QGG1_9VIBR|nr:electron transfer flavoprotein subunit alpha/FixB family protein [Vibrio porteresiae]WPC75581.1 electron transfer flavoprotein subunit alpha/FixB family protein [Vibrio porteresiae DSM 19223]
MSEFIVRRDPHTEWILRNRLHPEHQTLCVPVIEERGPNGLLRRYPHRVGFIGPNGLKRIDRLNQATGNSVQRLRAVGPSETVLPLHKVEAPDFYMVVVPDLTGGRLTSHDKDILGQAHQLVKQYPGQGAVMVVAFGETKEEHFDLAGADRLIVVCGERFEHYDPEAKAHVLAQIEQTYVPRHWLFPDSIQGGFEIGARLCALVGERPATQAWSVDAEFSVCRASGGRHDIKRSTPRVLLLAPECALPVDETRHEAMLMDFAVELTHASAVRDLGAVAVDPQAVPLTEAEFILSAGNGIHDWETFHAAAAALGATEGASRVAVDDGFMPRHRQVGATGSWVTARVYVAVGISGAIQHLQGIGACDKVIAINTDAGCDMVKRADLSVIADSNAFLRALMALIQKYQAEELKDAA